MKNRGITLISIIVSIIVLLILAGISIAMLSEDRAIIKQAGNAKKQTDIGQEEEILKTAVLSAIGKKEYGKLSKDKLKTELDNCTEIERIKEVNEGIEVTFKSSRVYLVDINGEVTQKKPRIYSNDVKTALTDGKYVTYSGKPYRVLYDANSEYGWIEVVSLNPLETVTLGYNDPAIPETADGYDFTGTSAQFEKSRWSYNNAIETLNNVAQKYLTSLSDRARCVGSDPDNPTYDIIETTYSNEYSYMDTKGWNNIFKIEDTNYTNSGFGANKDWEQLIDINAAGNAYNSLSEDYWLASRKVLASSNFTIFSVRRSSESGVLDAKPLVIVYGGFPQNPSAGFRPVIRLKDTIKITGGEGTSGSPYTLGL